MRLNRSSFPTCRALLLSVAAPLAFALPLAASDSAPTRVVEQTPVSITRVNASTFLVDFGRDAFGNLDLKHIPTGSQPVVIRFGEALRDDRVDRTPPGSVRYYQVTVPAAGGATQVVAPPADARNTHQPAAVLTPPDQGVLVPFRWVEIEGWTGELRPADIQRRAVFDATWSDDAAAFHSSDAMLDKIWDLSHYSIKATTFAGIFVDGDRERIAYEADAYLNQLGYYAGDANPLLPRVTFDRLIQQPTWPSEWAPHMVFIAAADWIETGDRAWLSSHYEVLKTKLLSARVGVDGLVTSSAQDLRKGDIVDWPDSERDGYVFTPVNTVVNAFRLRALREMATLAAAVGKPDEAADYQRQYQSTLATFQAKLFDTQRGLYRDGVGTEHASLHANLFPLAFGLTPPTARAQAAQWLADRGMACSVYAAQYLMEALFENGQSTAALNLMTAPGDRSWRHMVDAGTTITWEAWDQRYKPNQDWNHAWGAAPANLLPRFVLGVQPIAPGWKQAEIEPHPGMLASAAGRVPTPLGEVRVSWTTGKVFRMHVSVPEAMQAQLRVPVSANGSKVLLNGKPVAARLEGAYWTLPRDVSGEADVEVR